MCSFVLATCRSIEGEELSERRHTYMSNDHICPHISLLEHQACVVEIQ